MAKFTDDYGLETDELRSLPTGGGGNILCGKVGYAREIAFRKQRNESGEMYTLYDLPSWESLKVYDKAEDS